MIAPGARTVAGKIGSGVGPATMTCDLDHCIAVVDWQAKCSNPSRAASFRYLKEGRLFRLENDPTLKSCNVTTREYFWLCRCCSSTMTLRLKEDGTVVMVLLPEPIYGVPNGVALTSADREKGLLLRSVSSSLPEHLGGHVRTRLKGAHHAS